MITKKKNYSGTTMRWVVPCYFTEENQKITPLHFDLTKYLKVILSNEVWNRKFSFGYGPSLKKTNINDIIKVSVTIHPRFFSGPVDFKRIPKIVESVCGKIPSYLEVNGYKFWKHMHDCAIIEVNYKYEVVTIPTKKDLTGDIIPHYQMEFIEIYQRHLAVIKEVSAFFLAVMHLSFPTHSVLFPTDNPANDGILQIQSKDLMYASRVVTDAYMHEILIQPSKFKNVDINMAGLSKVWHYNLWSLKRYLIAVESDQISMDNLLDLLFAIEGLFEKNTSSDFVKTIILLKLCKNRKEARSMKSILDAAFRIRNDIAHGSKSYNFLDYIKVDGKEILSEQIFFKLKGITAAMLIEAISKLLATPELKNMRFTDEDLINAVFPV